MKERNEQISFGTQIFELIVSTIEHNEINNDWKSYLATTAAINEHRIISINLGRQKGHSYAALRLLNHFAHSYIFTLNNENVKVLKGKREYIGLCADLDKCIFVYDDLDRNLISKAPKLLICDLASHSKLSLKNLFETFKSLEYLVLLQ